MGALLGAAKYLHRNSGNVIGGVKTLPYSTAFMGAL